MNTRHYRAEDRLWFKDRWGHEFNATIVGKTKTALLIRRDTPMIDADESLNLDDCLMSRHFPKGRELTKKP